MSAAQWEGDWKLFLCGGASNVERTASDARDAVVWLDSTLWCWCWKAMLLWAEQPEHNVRVCLSFLVHATSSCSLFFPQSFAWTCLYDEVLQLRRRCQISKLAVTWLADVYAYKTSALRCFCWSTGQHWSLPAAFRWTSTFSSTPLGSYTIMSRSHM